MGDRIFLTPDEALAMLPDRDRIHTTRRARVISIGCYWDRADIEEAIRQADIREESGPRAARHGYRLAIHNADGMLFIETKEQR